MCHSAHLEGIVPIKQIKKNIVKKLFPKCLQNNVCIFGSARMLKLDHIYKLNVASFMFNIKQMENFLHKDPLSIFLTPAKAITQQLVKTCCYHTVELKLLG